MQEIVSVDILRKRRNWSEWKIEDEGASVGPTYTLFLNDTIYKVQEDIEFREGKCYMENSSSLLNGSEKKRMERKRRVPCLSGREPQGSVRVQLRAQTGFAQ